jgi:hypothetical protein
MAQDARKFMLTTDYPIPILVWKMETSLTVPVGQYFNAAHKSVAHGLPFTPWIIGQWSTNANFQPAYDLANDMPVFTGTRPDLMIIIGADSTHIRISAEHTAESSKTLYFRIFSFLPPDYSGDYDDTLGDSTAFTFDSEFNYPKLFKSGTISVPHNTTKTVSHGLGYIPQVRAWEDKETGPLDDYETWNILSPVNNGSFQGELSGVSVNTSTVKFGNPNGSDTTFRYMIFGDEV